jgi:uncharacterized membrane protein YeiH
MQTLPLVLDLAGTFVFALSGALAGVKHKLDLFGVLLLSGAISDWRYLAVSLAAGLITFSFSSVIIRLWSPVLLFNAAGLALFAVAGAQKALTYRLGPVMAILPGMLTGIGGGMAALAGAAVIVTGHLLQLPAVPVALAGLALCFGLRLLAIRLPIAWDLRCGPVRAALPAGQQAIPVRGRFRRPRIARRT